MTQRVWLAMVVVLALGCRDVTAPTAPPAARPEAQAQRAAEVAPPIHILRQSPTAPSLRRYQVSFWVRHDRASLVTVNYRRVAGQSTAQPFLRFSVPKFGLMFRPDGTPLEGSDSIRVTLRIDRAQLSVDFEPSGVQFSRVRTPELTLWYANADPDLDDNGIVDATDAHLEDRLALWGRSNQAHAWAKLQSKKDRLQQSVTSRLYHFSEYAVCW